MTANYKKIGKIRTGGQSGVDRAAMDVARMYNIPLCGWCPKYGWAEDYPAPPGLLADYPELTETPSEGTAQRTQWNMRDADAILTIIPEDSRPSTGTDVGLAEGERQRKPMLTVSGVGDVPGILRWLDELPDGIELCVGGPRASECVTAYDVAKQVLMEVVRHYSRPTILITAFEPFGGDRINSSEVVLNMLPESIDDITIHKLHLPVEYKRAVDLIIAEYDKVSPAAVIMLGQAGGRGAINIETTGRNVMNAHIPDNAGFAPKDIPVMEDGPDTLSVTLPVSRFREAIHALGIPCEISDNAGEYVCNTLLYSMLAYNKGKVPTGFIHVPSIREQGHEDKPFMESEDIYKGIIIIIKLLMKEEEHD